MTVRARRRTLLTRRMALVAATMSLLSFALGYLTHPNF
jgi:hypothetical protein